MPPSKDIIFILLFIPIGKFLKIDNTGQIGFEFFFTNLDCNCIIYIVVRRQHVSYLWDIH